ncbi:hypothetical protein BZA05DRAFT_383921 [Tricharina praecox]|uniref:uncharacterized protein n=1 Tax=Tricharina praecox TaxID=43433 RepID=UPI00221F95E4|nr:uncharacterized protein BZA05DRAFT_383921 [Tricharina praecox]KAI5857546.1 hypothetical protein BZA05DRAFT_383921 [Tricharina praecox]
MAPLKSITGTGRGSNRANITTDPAGSALADPHSPTKAYAVSRRRPVVPYYYRPKFGKTYLPWAPLSQRCKNINSILRRYDTVFSGDDAASVVVAAGSESLANRTQPWLLTDPTVPVTVRTQPRSEFPSPPSVLGKRKRGVLGCAWHGNFRTGKRDHPCALVDFDTLSEQIAHVKDVHDDYVCPFCEKHVACDDEGQYRLLDDGYTIKRIEDMVTTSPKGMRDHVLRKHCPSYRCPMDDCTSVLGTWTDFKKHLKKQHNVSDVNAGAYRTCRGNSSQELLTFVSNIQTAKDKAAIREIAFPNGADVPLFDDAVRPRIGFAPRAPPSGTHANAPAIPRRQQPPPEPLETPHSSPPLAATAAHAQTPADSGFLCAGECPDVTVAARPEDGAENSRFASFCRTSSDASSQGSMGSLLEWIQNLPSCELSQT